MDIFIRSQMSFDIFLCTEVNMKSLLNALIIFLAIALQLIRLIYCNNYSSEIQSLKNKEICSNVSNETLPRCFDFIKKWHWSKNESHIHPNLLCVQTRIASITWSSDVECAQSAIQIVSSANQSIVKYSHSNSTAERKFTSKKLEPDSEYTALIICVPSSGKMSPNDVAELTFKTMPANWNPYQLFSFNITAFSSASETNSKATIEWHFPSSVKPCICEACYSDRVHYPTCEYENFPISNDTMSMNSVLQYGTSYDTWLSFENDTTKTCERVLHNSYKVPGCHYFLNESQCVIPQIENITASSDCSVGSDCSVNISWHNRDNYQPDYFQVKIEIRELDGNKTLHSVKNVANNNLEINLPYNTVYDVTIMAFKHNKFSNPVSDVFDTPSFDGKHSVNVFYITLGISVPIVTFIFIQILLINRNRPKHAKLKKEYIIDITNKRFIDCNSKLEKKSGDPEKTKVVYKVIRGEVLGKGNFGIVFRGTLMSNNKKVKDVAVKTLQDNATYKDIQQFKQEIRLMEDVGSHANIVSMIGSYYDSKRPLLVVEYCALGDLHTYLNEMKKSVSNLSDYNSIVDIQYQNLVTIENEVNFTHLVHNKIYGTMKDAVPELSFCDLLSFARQVTSGLEYLESNHVVHRDVAARNVLLAPDKKVKISDFGLSRDIYVENIYRKPLQSGDLMPIKWMALESINNQEYTTKSDVWSFGIFLWELFTFGDDPYPDITSPEVLVLRLREGYRMKNPCPACPEIYEIMLNCWHEQPELRPQFALLHDLLDQMLRECAPHQYITLTGNEG